METDCSSLLAVALPRQWDPLLVNPALHEQVKPPSVFSQYEFSGHTFNKHSLMSEN